jgi:hypothetical protein
LNKSIFKTQTLFQNLRGLKKAGLKEKRLGIAPQPFSGAPERERRLR